MTTTPSPVAQTPLREAHAHLAMYGQALTMPDLGACASVAECLERAGAQARATPPGRWARLHGARVESWTPPRWPTRDELDAATGDVPCAILSFDYHHVLGNSAALRAAGLDPASADAGSGLLREQEGSRLWSSGPQPERPEIKEHVAAALGALRALAYTEVHDLLSAPTLGPILGDLEREGRLPMPVWLYPPLEQIEREIESAKTYASPRVRLAGAKVFADGTLNGRTASMLHRYALPLPDLPRGQCLMSPAALDAAIARADAIGLPLAVHAIGDCAVRMTLDAFERVRPRTGGQRLEHAEIIDAADIPRFASLGVTCSVQPCHLLADAEALHRYLAHRLPRVLPLRDLLDSGLVPGHLGLDGRAGLVFGSDVPVVGADPRDSIQAAVHRRRPGDPEDAMIAPRQAISEAEAWACFGIG